MRSRKAFLLTLLLFPEVLAQSSEGELRSKIAAVRYPPLGEQARIQGDVHLKLNCGVVAVISGHPLLSPLAVDNLKSWIADKTDADVTYHFVLVDAAEANKPVTVKKGNAFERAMLRLFGLKTEKVVLEYQCQEGVSPANNVKISGGTIDIWIYGHARCLQPQTAQLMARR
jgi:hypothetical protein